MIAASRSPEILTAIHALNSLHTELERTEKNTKSIDLIPTFLDAQGQPCLDSFVEDGTHFSPKSYAAVTELLSGKL